MPIDMKQFSQPYVGTEAEMLTFLNAIVDAEVAVQTSVIAAAVATASTTAELVDEADAINTTNKFAGKMVWDATLGQPVWADGPGVNDTWSLSTGVVSTTPAP